MDKKTGKAESIGKLFEYDSFRRFLADFIEEEKRRKPGFSQRAFASRLGFSSTGSLSLVLSGKRRLGEAPLQKLAGAIGLAGRHARFLEALARFNQAGTLEERERTFQEVKRLRKSREFRRTLASQFPYWEEWHHVVVRELAVHMDWRGDWAALGAAVRPPISGEKARHSVERLLEMGLLRRDPDGSYAQSSPVLSASGAPSSLLREFKREMVLKSLQAMDDLPPSRRHFSTCTLSMSRESFRKLSGMIDALREEILRIASDDDAQEVYQANFQVFPVSTEIVKKGRPSGN